MKCAIKDYTPQISSSSLVILLSWPRSFLNLLLFTPRLNYSETDDKVHSSLQFSLHQSNDLLKMKFNAPSGNAVHFRLFPLHGSVLLFSVSVVRYIRSHRDFYSLHQQREFKPSCVKYWGRGCSRNFEGAIYHGLNPED